jgi:UBX domain-containing protein 1
VGPTERWNRSLVRGYVDEYWKRVLQTSFVRIDCLYHQYRDGFTVDDGPYRRLDDPDNAEFLRALAMGRTPRELAHDSEGSSNIVVGLVDKRNQDFVETFRSFSGAGTSLGTTTTSTDGVFDPTALPDPTPPAAAAGVETTSVAVRLANGKRKVVKIALTSTVADLAAHLRDDAVDGTPFRLVAGFPPKPIQDTSATIEAAGLKGAQVSMQNA